MRYELPTMNGPPLSDVGHMAMLDAPERVSELIMQAA